MAAPASARPMPAQMPNSSTALCAIQDESGAVIGRGFISKSWYYVMSLFAQKSSGISGTFSQVISNPPTQAEVQALSNQVALLSKQLGLGP